MSWLDLVAPPEKVEEGNPCFYFSFPTAAVKLQNKVGPDKLYANICVSVFDFGGGSGEVGLRRVFLTPHTHTHTFPSPLHFFFVDKKGEGLH